MRNTFSIADCSRQRFRRGFSLVEVLLVMTMLSLIVLVLMAVFSNTQRAFRASITQADVLEGGRMATDLIAADLRGLAPAGGPSNSMPGWSSPVNFFVLANQQIESGYSPMEQSLPGSTVARTNLLNYCFILGRQNDRWTGVGYVVNSTNTSTLYPLYRYYAETNIQTSPFVLVDQFYADIQNGRWDNLSHLVDGVVHLTLRAYDPSGRWINNQGFPVYTNALNTPFLSGAGYGEAQFYMFSNTVPASVELELGILENHALARAESLPQTPVDRRTPFLKEQAGAVHVFRQRVAIPNVDYSAYQ